jgi:ATP-dependent phosphofructokinase / diphosphate-dependent phosphofructokinase
VRIGVLTGGGDCPGLNAVIRGVVDKGARVWGDDFVGFAEGWRGLIEGNTLPLDPERCRNILFEGGTILGTSRTNPYKSPDGAAAVQRNFQAEGLDALVAIGGDDTLGVALKLDEEGLAVVGVPKTIDNDLAATEVTFGFHTAVQVASDAIDRLRTTAASHDRIIVCEVMGREAGWIATYAGISGDAAAILVPEEPFDIDAVAAMLVERRRRGRFPMVVVVAEGAVPKEGSLVVRSGEVDQFGHARLGGIGNLVAEELEARTGFESRAAVLGHVQRGGTPTAYDRVLATRFGVGAIDAVHDGAFGMMVSIQADHIVRVPLSAAVAQPKMLDPSLLHDVAEVFWS